MGKDSERFRKRARHCRDLAAQTKDKEWRGLLLDLAHDLEEEADRDDAENPL